MDRRDWELLDRQTKRFQTPSPREGVMIAVLVGAFLAGMTAGGAYSFGSHSSAQTPSEDGKTTLAFFLNSGQRATR
jgi:hypothetical protein